MAIPYCLHMLYNLTLFHSLFLTNHYALCWDNLKETLLLHSKNSGHSGKDSQPATNNRLITVLLWFTLTTEKEVVDAMKRHMRDWQHIQDEQTLGKSLSHELKFERTKVTSQAKKAEDSIVGKGTKTC